MTLGESSVPPTASGTPSAPAASRSTLTRPLSALLGGDRDVAGRRQQARGRHQVVSCTALPCVMTWPASVSSRVLPPRLRPTRLHRLLQVDAVHHRIAHRELRLRAACRRSAPGSRNSARRLVCASSLPVSGRLGAVSADTSTFSVSRSPAQRPVPGAARLQAQLAGDRAAADRPRAPARARPRARTLPCVPASRPCTILNAARPAGRRRPRSTSASTVDALALLVDPGDVLEDGAARHQVAAPLSGCGAGAGFALAFGLGPLLHRGAQRSDGRLRQHRLAHHQRRDLQPPGQQRRPDAAAPRRGPTRQHRPGLHSHVIDGHRRQRPQVDRQLARACSGTPSAALPCVSTRDAEVVAAQPRLQRDRHGRPAAARTRPRRSPATSRRFAMRPLSRSWRSSPMPCRRAALWLAWDLFTFPTAQPQRKQR